jgi:chromate transporter
LKGALGAVTAAVVGVIANLALWFGLRVIFRDVQSLSLGPVRLDVPVAASLDPAALALAIFAAVLLFPMKQGLARSLGFTAIAGLVLKFAGF